MAVNSVSGTALQIDVADGTNDAVVSIDSGYVGQASINTLGTVTTGTWNAGDVTTSGKITLPATSSSSVGLIVMGNQSVLHEGTGTARNNIFVGQGAGNFTLNPIAATNNCGFGAASLIGLDEGTNNTAVGSFAGSGINNGDNNVLIGKNAGTNYSGSESSNILIGSGQSGTNGESNKLRIGTSTGTSGSGAINGAFICGINGIVVTGVSARITTGNQLGVASSSRRFKNTILDMRDDSSPIMNLRPVTFLYNEDIAGADGVKQFGLIAEEVAEVMPELVTFKDEKPFTVKYEDFTSILINELQKLNKRVQELEAKMAA